jgi:hypothetical protein
MTGTVIGNRYKTSFSGSNPSGLLACHSVTRWLVSAKDHLNSEYLYKTQIVMQHLFDNFSTNMKRIFHIHYLRFGLRKAVDCLVLRVLLGGLVGPSSTRKLHGVCSS